jgi:microsomal dipeptidase-like Zn-dependent dipeptidase/gamma-glutamyl-gamma-aminobutyrate hydrolase PuuD
MSKPIDELNRKVDSFNKTLRNRPLIGVTANRKEGLLCIAEPYYQSVLMAGGVPVVLPVTNDIETLTAAVEAIDGLLLTGGGDIDACYLEEEPHPSLGGVDTLRDECELTLIRLAFNRQIPIMGICRGHQVLNVAFGGTLYQDLPTQYSASPLQHSQEEPRNVRTHDVCVLPEYNGFSGLSATYFVNSLHHQAVKDVAEGFITTAIATDSLNEAIEHTEYELFSVQWHPEHLTVNGDETMLQLFQRLTSEAAIYQKAKELHSKYFAIDSHTDTPLFFELGYNLGKKNYLSIPPGFQDNEESEPYEYEVKVDIPKMREGIIEAVCMAAYIPQGELTEEATENAVCKAFSIIKQIKEQLRNNEAVVAQAVTADDIRRNRDAGKKSVLIGLENGYAIGKELRNIERYAEEGVVYITLCHNNSNALCDSAIGASLHNGLSAFGKAAVREMNRVGIIPDISHTSEKTSFDILETSEAPVIASHSSVKALCNHRRNVSDELLKAIAEKGGVVQVCLYSRFLCNNGSATYRDAADHICYVADKVGVDYVGIGSDFDGCDDAANLRGINEFIKITKELIRRGYSDEDVRKIIGGNLLRLLKRNK